MFRSWQMKMSSWVDTALLMLTVKVLSTSDTSRSAVNPLSKSGKSSADGILSTSDTSISAVDTMCTSDTSISAADILNTSHTMPRSAVDILSSSDTTPRSAIHWASLVSRQRMAYWAPLIRHDQQWIHWARLISSAHNQHVSYNVNISSGHNVHVWHVNISSWHIEHVWYNAKISSGHTERLQYIVSLYLHVSDSAFKFVTWLFKWIF
jgi:hypothetical protein